MTGIRCEICQGTDIIKEGDFFVCKTCGAKYTPEAARKLIRANPSAPPAEAAPETHAIDASQTDNWRTLARRARMEGNNENAVKYYGLLSEKDPQDWEAYFYQTYFRSRQCKLAGIPLAVTQVVSSLLFTHGIISKSSMSDEEKLAAFKTVADSAVAFADFIFNVADNYSSQNSSNMYSRDSANEWIASAFKLYATACIIANDSSSSSFHSAPGGKAYALSLYKKYNDALAKYGGSLKKDVCKKFMAENTEIIKKIDPDYVQPEREGCYIATCVYGSYDCPEVWTLRRLRDFKLAASAPGRIFIRIYYTLSPGLVSVFGQNALFKAFWRRLLTPLVKHLNVKGYPSTPYCDRHGKK